MEWVLGERFPCTTLEGKRARVNLVRYADDFIVTGATREVLEEEVRPLLEDFLRERGLELSPEKTIVTHITQGFDFLGQNVRKYDGKLLIKPTKESVTGFLREVRRRIERNRGATAGDLISELNPLIRGWANRHRHIESRTTFYSVDNAIADALWSWAVRRHPNKPKEWIKEKYFRVRGGKRWWAFTGTVEGASGKDKVVRLFAAHWVPVRRHRIIESRANPYDPDWDHYFKARRKRAMKRSDVTEGTLRVPQEVVAALGEDPEREALEALLLHLIRTDRASVAWAGEKLGLDSVEAVRWYTSHGYPFPDYTEKEIEEDLRHAERFRA